MFVKSSRASVDSMWNFILFQFLFHKEKMPEKELLPQFKGFVLDKIVHDFLQLLVKLMFFRKLEKNYLILNIPKTKIYKSNVFF